MAAITHGWNAGLDSNGLPRRLKHRPTNREAQTASQLAESSSKKNMPAIVELYTVKRIDNSRLVRRVEPLKMRRLYRTSALGAIVAAFFMLYIYQHFRCIDLSFQLEALKGKQEQAAALNGDLKLEIATLRDPRRIDMIAQHQLGLTQAAPTQVREYSPTDGAEVASVRYVRPNRVP